MFLTFRLGPSGFCERWFGLLLFSVGWQSISFSGRFRQQRPSSFAPLSRFRPAALTRAVETGRGVSAVMDLAGNICTGYEF